MKKNIYLLLIVFLFMLLPSFVYADCTDEVIAHFKKIENDYKITYEFNREKESYNIKIYNAEPEQFIFVPEKEEDNVKCTELEKQNVECEGFTMDIHPMLLISTSEECDYVLTEKDLDLSKKNKYWNDPLCKDLEEFVLCDPSYDKEISYDDFKSRIETYKKSKVKKEKETTKNKDNNNQIIEYIGKNYQILSIIIALSIALVLLIILIARNLKKSRRLE